MYGNITLYVMTFQPIPLDHESYGEVLQPRHCRNNTGLGSFHFARHYSGNRYFFLFLRILRCFSSPRWLSSLSDKSSTCQVVPFGYVRIKSCLQIPAPFRSLPRPSSPPEAKASSVRPCNFSRYEFLFVSFNFVNCSPSKTFYFIQTIS